MSVLQKAAEILVECGYAYDWRTQYSLPVAGSERQFLQVNKNQAYAVAVCFDEDTLEGRRQADAIENWLRDNHRELWHKTVVNNLPEAPYHQWRLDRIKWCLKELSNDMSENNE